MNKISATLRVSRLLIFLICLSFSSGAQLSALDLESITDKRKQGTLPFYEVLQSIQEQQLRKDTATLGKSYLKMSRLFFEEGINDSAFFYLKKIEPLIESHAHFKSDFVARYNLYLSIAAARRGDSKQALDYAFKGQTSLTEMFVNNEVYSKLLSEFYIQIGMLFVNAAQMDQGRKYIRLIDSIEVLHPNPKTKATAIMLKGMSITGTSADSLRMSIAYFEDAAKISEENELHSLFAFGMMNMATAYCSMDSLEKAKAILIELLKPEYPKKKLELLSAYSTIGAVYYCLKDFQNAIYYLELAYKGGKNLNDPDMVFYAIDHLYKTHKELRHYQTALALHEEYHRLKTNREGREIKNELAEMELKYKAAAKDKELASRTLELERQKNKLDKYLIAGGGILFVLGLIIFSIRKRQRNRIINIEKEQELNNLKAMIAGEEKERSRIAAELHDGIGAMVAVAKMGIHNIVEQYPQEAALKVVNIQLDKTSQEIRGLAHNLAPSVLENNTLETALMLYCDRLMAGGELYIEIQTDVLLPDFNEQAKLTLYRVFQELLQNIVKHAKADKAYIQIRNQPDVLLIIVEDNGRGFDTEKVNYGLGLKNIQIRINALEGTFDMQSALGMGSTFVITCPNHNLI